MEKIIGRLLGDILVKSGAVTAEQLEQALQTQRETGGYLGEILLSLGFIKENTFAYALSLQYGQDIPYIDLDKHALTPDVIRLIPREFVNRYRIVPVDRFRDILTIATASPENIEDAMAGIAELTGMKLEFLLTTTSQLNRAIARYF